MPSSPVVDSFATEAPHLKSRLFFNPYGVDLNLFPQRMGPRPGRPPRVLFAGVWSLRKGVDILMRAMKSLPGVMLTHVGGQGDHPFPAAIRSLKGSGMSRNGSSRNITAAPMYSYWPRVKKGSG